MNPNPFIRLTIAIFLAIAVAAGGCRKAFLAQRPSSNLLIPNSLSVLQELLDNERVMNVSPALGEVSADNYFLTSNTWTSLDTKDYNAYVWAADLYQGQGSVPDWDLPYQQVFYANTVLQGLAQIRPDSTEVAEWNKLEGWALFSRAFAFFNIAELFAKPYDSATAGMDPGIPIRLSPDINEKTTRATMQSTYDQILDDLHRAAAFLPVTVPGNNLNRPSRLAAQALLARIYLSMRVYDSAGWYANTVLQAYPFLLDYNSLNVGGFVPFADAMREVLFQANFPVVGNFLEGIVCRGCVVDTSLVDSYDSNDLRRPAFYFQRAADTFNMKGSYAGSVFPFSGLATDEMYLIRAESEARAGNAAGAINDVNTLLAHRWRTGSFTAETSMTAPQALDTVLAERRRELAFRGIRWSDLRRLNQEGRLDTLHRVINGQVYTLFPNSDLYTLPIPPDVIRFSGIMQNPREP
ncbi:MAG TPA: RagB/SusD family nutrient uptake outer membrane protein [Puia sp.]|nr:RagB/SusD family nutrient uptake outer membrane protein [Puia sp.]